MISNLTEEEEIVMLLLVKLGIETYTGRTLAAIETIETIDGIDKRHFNALADKMGTKPCN